MAPPAPRYLMETVLSGRGHSIVFIMSHEAA